eukprot:scaffold59_cov133-Skeletonema_dohrnii-CCMP3373.AAC.1
MLSCEKNNKKNPHPAFSTLESEFIEALFARNTNTTALSMIEAIAAAQLIESKREGLPPAVPPQIQYTASKFELSIAQSSSIQFSVHRVGDIKQEWVESYESLTDQIVCVIDRINTLNMNHIPHFARAAFPCWSILHQFPNAERYVKVRNFDWDEITSEWIIDLMKVFNAAGIQVVDYFHNSFVSQSNHSQSKSEWVATFDIGGGGFPAANGDGSAYEIQNSKYFVNRMSDVQSLQKHVLGTLYHNTREERDEAQLRVLLIDRKGATREWPYAKSTAAMIEHLWGKRVVVDIVSNFEGSLRSQAAKFHWADIVITPHGAQNTNLAFIQPCASVLELFPRGYYLGYFQPLVLSAGGVAFDGYPSGRLRSLDTVSTVSTLEGRVKAREGPINTSPESILQAFPDLVLNSIACRRGLDK